MYLKKTKEVKAFNLQVSAKNSVCVCVCVWCTYFCKINWPTRIMWEVGEKTRGNSTIKENKEGTIKYLGKHLCKTPLCMAYDGISKNWEKMEWDYNSTEWKPLESCIFYISVTYFPNA